MRASKSVTPSLEDSRPTSSRSLSNSQRSNSQRSDETHVTHAQGDEQRDDEAIKSEEEELVPTSQESIVHTREESPIVQIIREEVVIEEATSQERAREELIEEEVVCEEIILEEAQQLPEAPTEEQHAAIEEGGSAEDEQTPEAHAEEQHIEDEEAAEDEHMREAPAEETDEPTQEHTPPEESSHALAEREETDEEEEDEPTHVEARTPTEEEHPSQDLTVIEEEEEEDETAPAATASTPRPTTPTRVSPTPATLTPGWRRYLTPLASLFSPFGRRTPQPQPQPTPAAASEATTPLTADRKRAAPAEEESAESTPNKRVKTTEAEAATPLSADRKRAAAEEEESAESTPNKRVKTTEAEAVTESVTPAPKKNTPRRNTSRPRIPYYMPATEPRRSSNLRPTTATPAKKLDLAAHHAQTVKAPPPRRESLLERPTTSATPLRRSIRDIRQLKAQLSQQRTPLFSQKEERKEEHKEESRAPAPAPTPQRVPSVQEPAPSAPASDNQPTRTRKRPAPAEPNTPAQKETPRFLMPSTKHPKTASSLTPITEQDTSRMSMFSENTPAPMDTPSKNPPATAPHKRRSMAEVRAARLGLGSASASKRPAPFSWEIKAADRELQRDGFQVPNTPTSKNQSAAAKPRDPNADKRYAKLERKRQLERELEQLKRDADIIEMESHRRKRVKVDNLAFIPHNRPGDAEGTFRVPDIDSDDEMEVDDDVPERTNVFEEASEITATPAPTTASPAKQFNFPSATTPPVVQQPAPSDAFPTVSEDTTTAPEPVVQSKFNFPSVGLKDPNEPEPSPKWIEAARVKFVTGFEQWRLVNGY
jgi:hypothetical protein